MRDHSEYIDDYCMQRFGHTNWGYLSTYDKKELSKKDEYVIQGGIVYWLKDDIPDIDIPPAPVSTPETSTVSAKFTKFFILSIVISPATIFSTFVETEFNQL